MVPHPGTVATCECCGAELIPKCGNIRIHHWAHKGGHDCDHWWEPETEWHRKWKNKFPEEWQEIVKSDIEAGERHRADIYNPGMELVIEFQNSSLDILEKESREKFYKKMLWVVNAAKFDFHIHPLDEWNEHVGQLARKFKAQALKRHELPYDLYMKDREGEARIHKLNLAVAGGEMTREIADAEKMQIRDQLLKDMINFYINRKDDMSITLKKNYEEVQRYMQENKKKGVDEFFVMYTWNRRRKVWDMGQLPVFFDLGREMVLIKSQYVAKRVPIEKFLKKYRGGSSVIDSKDAE